LGEGGRGGTLFPLRRITFIVFTSSVLVYVVAVHNADYVEAQDGISINT
jgi:hypothetical protein